MEELLELSKVTLPKKGNKPNFDEAHALLALMIIEKEQPIGRNLLMRKLSLTEASTRTLIRRLRELNLITVDRVAGILLTELGTKIANEIRTKVQIKEDAKLESINWNGMMILLKNGSRILSKVSVLELRDLIIKQGATRTLIGIVNESGKIELPPKSLNESEEVKRLKEELERQIPNLQTGDLIVVFEPPDIHLAYKITFAILTSA